MVGDWGSGGRRDDADPWTQPCRSAARRAGRAPGRQAAPWEAAPWEDASWGTGPQPLPSGTGPQGPPRWQTGPQAPPSGTGPRPPITPPDAGQPAGLPTGWNRDTGEWERAARAERPGRFGEPAYPVDDDYPAGPADESGPWPTASAVPGATGASAARPGPRRQAGTPLAPGEQARAAEPLARLGRSPRSGRGVMIRRLALLGGVLLALAAVTLFALSTKPAASRATLAAGQAAAVTSVTRSCPPSAPGEGTAHVSMIAVPSQSSSSAGTATATARRARPAPPRSARSRPRPPPRRRPSRQGQADGGTARPRQAAPPRRASGTPAAAAGRARHRQRARRGDHGHRPGRCQRRRQLGVGHRADGRGVRGGAGRLVGHGPGELLAPELRHVVRRFR